MSVAPSMSAAEACHRLRRADLIVVSVSDECRHSSFARSPRKYCVDHLRCGVRAATDGGIALVSARGPALLWQEKLELSDAILQVS